jgi:stalled ribosome rescue protein Dom34
MSEKNKKQFGIWMDSHHATVVGRQNIDNGDFVVLNHVKNAGPDSNSSESAANHQEITLTHKFFKEIVAKIANMDEVHVTGTGQIQEEFIKFLADTAQYKNALSSESTSNKMSDEDLLTFISKHFK